MKLAFAPGCSNIVRRALSFLTFLSMVGLTPFPSLVGFPPIQAVKELGVQSLRCSSSAAISDPDSDDEDSEDELLVAVMQVSP